MRTASSLLVVGFLFTSGALAEPNGSVFTMSRPAWRLHVPAGYEPRPEGAYDLLVHFHGDPATVQRNVAASRLNAVVVTANYNGLSSAYRRPFEEAGLFQTLLDDVAATLRTYPRFGPKATRDRLAVSSFSAGYGAVREILKQPRYVEAIDGVLAADSLYASTAADGTPEDEQMAPYKRFADLAAAGEKTFLLTHTEVPTPTYESTRDTADELLAHLGIEATAVDQKGRGPLRFTRTATRGRFILWGCPGETGDEHMDHFRYLAEWLDALPLAKRGE
ncbi:hypothetical protein MalM25_02700 [Planctomycetes bacterium MalM25]|nr:hypothetical protein MalM25_02700 [Planctomycetes bacterium MalM25]